MSPLVGFVCPSGKQVRFEECYTSCETRCMELPVLLALGEDIRQLTPGIYSTTEILNPPKVIYLQRQHDFFLPPQKMVWATFGLAFHSLIENQRATIKSLGLEKDYSFEYDNYFGVPINVNGKEIILTGRPDQYQISAGILTDYKSLKYYYDIIYLKEKNDWSGSKYHWQVNIYRRFAFPRCKKMQLVALVKDFNRRVEEKGINPIEIIEVPWIEDAEIDEKIDTIAKEILRNIDDPLTIPNCTEKETWKGVRCQEYCPVNVYCSQYEKTLAKEDSIAL